MLTGLNLRINIYALSLPDARKIKFFFTIYKINCDVNIVSQMLKKFNILNSISADGEKKMCKMIF